MKAFSIALSLVVFGLMASAVQAGPRGGLFGRINSSSSGGCRDGTCRPLSATQAGDTGKINSDWMSRVSDAARRPMASPGCGAQRLGVLARVKHQPRGGGRRCR